MCKVDLQVRLFVCFKTALTTEGETTAQTTTQTTEPQTTATEAGTAKTNCNIQNV